MGSGAGARSPVTRVLSQGGHSRMVRRAFAAAPPETPHRCAARSAGAALLVGSLALSLAGCGSDGSSTPTPGASASTSPVGSSVTPIGGQPTLTTPLLVSRLSSPPAFQVPAPERQRDL